MSEDNNKKNYIDKDGTLKTCKYNNETPGGLFVGKPVHSFLKFDENQVLLILLNVSTQIQKLQMR